MIAKKKKRPARRTTLSTPPVENSTLPFVEHVQELRQRLYYVAFFVVAWSCAAYAVQQRLTHLLLRPSHGQHFIYTTPGGGIDFLFRVCLYTGLVLSLPVIVYNSLRFVEPIIGKDSTRFILWGTFVSSLLALAGLAFGYLLGLPAALHFLMHQFTTLQIQPLLTIQSYLNFVIVYMVGSALLFQLPLFLIFINRIKPLKPSRLFHYERWVILIAFILAGLMNPSPNILSQLLVAGPFILMYQVGIAIIAIVNRPKRTSQARKLAQEDNLAQARRQQPLTQALIQPAHAPMQPVSNSPASPRMISEFKQPRPALKTTAQPQPPRPAAVRQQQVRPRRHFIDIIPAQPPSTQAFSPEV